MQTKALFTIGCPFATTRLSSRQFKQSISECVVAYIPTPPDCLPLFIQFFRRIPASRFNRKRPTNPLLSEVAVSQMLVA
mgnify:CR=1 FL=1